MTINHIKPGDKLLIKKDLQKIVPATLFKKKKAWQGKVVTVKDVYHSYFTIMEDRLSLAWMPGMVEKKLKQTNRVDELIDELSQYKSEIQINRTRINKLLNIID